MIRIALLLAGPLLLLDLTANSHARKLQLPQPDRFVIGRRTFFDFGPPFNYYEILSVRSTGGGSSVERIQLTPSRDVCREPPEVRLAAASISENIADLLGRTNPCAIPEKELRRELRRCKHCLVFSGVDVAMQVSCAGQDRLIRMNVLDCDLFDPHPSPPQHTSWTMGVLGRLDAALGSTVMEPPAFTLAEVPAPPLPERGASPLLEDLAAGQFDVLFGTSERVSELYQQAQTPPEAPAVTLVDSYPYHPISYALPGYPPIALAAHLRGRVGFTVEVKPDGHASSPKFLEGNPLLQPVVANAVAGWTFPAAAVGQEMRLTIEFKMSCPAPPTK